MPEPPSCHNCNSATTNATIVCPQCCAVLTSIDTTFDPIFGSLDMTLNVSLIHARAQHHVDTLRQTLAPELALSASAANLELRSKIRQTITDDPEPLSIYERGIVLQSVLDELFGFGPIGPLLRDPRTDSIYCIGTTPIAIRHNGQLRQTTCCFQSNDHLQNIIDRLSTILNTPAQSGLPSLQGKLPAGHHVRICLPPAVKTTTLSVTFAR